MQTADEAKRRGACARQKSPSIERAQLQTVAACWAAGFVPRFGRHRELPPLCFSSRTPECPVFQIRHDGQITSVLPESCQAPESKIFRFSEHRNRCI